MLFFHTTFDFVFLLSFFLLGAESAASGPRLRKRAMQEAGERRFGGCLGPRKRTAFGERKREREKGSGNVFDRSIELFFDHEDLSGLQLIVFRDLEGPSQHLHPSIANQSINQSINQMREFVKRNE